jgi:isoaspartyl peptidase/L-asparaginase-like protein (Ntn-hydrolase superfamily)
VREENLLLSRPAVAVHGGAGTFRRPGDPTELRDRLVEGMRRALAAAWQVLSNGGPALDAAVAAVSVMEDDGVFNAGRGSVRTVDGTVEFDAAVMDGTGQAGGICAATWPANPVQVARAVAELGDPVLLAGPGADRFAVSVGAPRMEASWLTGGLSEGPVSEVGTVGAVALDADGRVAAATSTGGRPGQSAGRVGDSPIPGAGTWADNRTVAVSATGAGEAFLLAGFAHLVDYLVRDGRSVATASAAALDAVAERGGSGGAIVLAPDGQLSVLFDTPAMARGWRDGTGVTVRAMDE